MSTAHNATEGTTTDRQAAMFATGTEGALDISQLFPEWQRRAACAALGNDRWFSDSDDGQGAHAQQAKAICARCPVAARCLDAALEPQERWGIWGGAGEAERRTFARARRKREHGPDPVEDCACGWCAEWVRHRQNLAAIATGSRREGRPGDRNGAGATHGRRSTQARGCRCPACVASASVVGQALTRSGVDTATFWVEHVDSWRSTDDQSRQFAAAGGEVLVGAAAGLLALAGVSSWVAYGAFLGTRFVTGNRGSLRPWAESLAAEDVPELLAA